ncbi:NAD(P)/FAD-dependent oxidoreductase [Solimonas sp. K1W22B-7]|uniref:flavin-containing monooxygenase n=1 Tax=Solimonas sp. K1W22B-7 TaxID=2303331 RepID=UPI000E336583|nr:NAD(P)/FAD-dependent oxidoreductase [Solimonas sp. K1W22B-7]AXQ30492.1 NAD(P)/FAD-dependent oxidoreductase [Solimonas sp. K1W22B-7]
MQTAHYDVVIIGAGISGVGAACHLERMCPGKTYTILERRQSMGGTWDLFRYPGIRSDSDMYTFGFNFRPWTEPKILADGPSIRQYVRDTAAEYGVDKNIRFGIKVISASWSSDEQLWTLTAVPEAGGAEMVFTCNFMIGATGYYNYDAGFQPKFPGQEKFKGQIIHPQHWPENLDYAGKRVVVIGSGATAITLVPSMAGKAGHVTMLQRSPTYIMTLPAIDPLSSRLQKFLPDMLVYRMARTRNVTLQRLLYQASRARPKVVRRLLLAQVKAQLGGKVDMKHFTPSYNPWDERLCVVPNGDLFKALKRGDASIVTDHIESFTAKGIKLKSGEELEADIIVSATGLNVQLMGGTAVSVDGKRFQPSEHMTYKGVLVEGVPNAAIIIGYTNASWTLKADIASEYICRVLKHMDKKGYGQVVPQDHDNSMVASETVMGGLNSGYIKRAVDQLPKQGNKRPWKIVQDYVRDVPVLRYSPIEDSALQFTRKSDKPASTPKPAAKKRQAA